MPNDSESSFSGDLSGRDVQARRSASLRSPQQIMCARLSKMEGLSRASAKGFIQDVPEQLERPKRRRSVLDDDESAFNKIVDSVSLDYMRNLQQQSRAVSQLIFSQFSQQFASLANKLKLENAGKQNVQTVQSVDHFHTMQYADSPAARQLEQLLIQYENLDEYITKKQINSLFIQYKPVIALYQYELEQQLNNTKEQPHIQDMLPKNNRFEQI